MDTIELLVSEVVTNAVLHAGGWVDLTIRHLGNRTRVEVRDGCARWPELCPPTVAHGRGMHIVAALAVRWGVEPHDLGKTVWFEVEDH